MAAMFLVPEKSGVLNNQEFPAPEPVPIQWIALAGQLQSLYISMLRSSRVDIEDRKGVARWNNNDPPDRSLSIGAR
jgi:hypothetical protein